jgi:GT2 family glycosyltransferase
MREVPAAGICGSTLLHYHDPRRIQALGGSSYNPWLGRGRHISGGLPADKSTIQPSAVESDLSYVVGASMLVRRRFLEEVGLMSEHYFLYFEELDWALRARSRFSLAYSPNSVVYHKEGASTGSSALAVRRSRLADFYSSRNRMLITRKYFPWAVIPTGAILALKALSSLMRGELAGFGALMKGLGSGLVFDLRETSKG